MKCRNWELCFALTCFRVKFATSMQPFYSFLYKKIFIFGVNKNKGCQEKLMFGNGCVCEAGCRFIISQGSFSKRGYFL